MRQHTHLMGKRLLSSALAILLAAACIVPAAAAEPIGDGVTPTYDEAYYATLDYYGNLLDGSVVKSYTLNGATSLTDYGTYDEVVNLTDGTTPAVAGAMPPPFRSVGKMPPSHFYFEGKTAAPFEALPWTLSVSYTLNGVAARARTSPARPAWWRSPWTPSPTRLPVSMLETTTHWKPWPCSTRTTSCPWRPPAPRCS